jgi:hypothetical protein
MTPNNSEVDRRHGLAVGVGESAYSTAPRARARGPARAPRRADRELRARAGVERNDANDTLALIAAARISVDDGAERAHPVARALRRALAACGRRDRGRNRAAPDGCRHHGGSQRHADRADARDLTVDEAQRFERTVVAEELHQDDQVSVGQLAERPAERLPAARGLRTAMLRGRTVATKGTSVVYWVTATSVEFCDLVCRRRVAEPPGREALTG